MCNEGKFTIKIVNSDLYSKYVVDVKNIDAEKAIDILDTFILDFGYLL